MSDLELGEEVRNAAQGAWGRYLGQVLPFRPVLHGYCMKLTGRVWDAEDLVQDTLLRAFGTLGTVRHSIENPKAYLLRIATNLWIDTVRRRGFEAAAVSAQSNDPTRESDWSPSPAQAAELRDAGARLMEKLAPQERAAVVLKDSFDLSLAETAQVLGTTVGAVKSALSRGRTRLDAPMEAHASPQTISKELVDRFVERYNDRDLPGLLDLMLDTGSIEMHSYVNETGKTAFERKGGWFHHNFEYPPEMPHTDARWERAMYEGEPIALVFTTSHGREAVLSVMRFEEVDGKVARLQVYALCPETVQTVARSLGYATHSDSLI